MLCSSETPKRSPRCWPVWGHGDQPGDRGTARVSHSSSPAAQQQQERWEGFSFQLKLRGQGGGQT